MGWLLLTGQLYQWLVVQTILVSQVQKRSPSTRQRQLQFGVSIDGAIYLFLIVLKLWDMCVLLALNTNRRY
jgi:hypothetical protein